MKKEICCTDARYMASKLAGTLRAAKVAETLYAAGWRKEDFLKCN